MKAVHILLLTLFTSMVFASCKTTEANYRAAYEKTIARDDYSLDGNLGIRGEAS